MKEWSHGACRTSHILQFFGADDNFTLNCEPHATQMARSKNWLGIEGMITVARCCGCDCFCQITNTL